MLSDISLSSLSRISVAGGDVLHALKCTDNGFFGFGEAYFSYVNPRSVKGWKLHKQMTMNLIVPVGLVKFVFCTLDPVHGPQFRIYKLGSSCYSRISVPPGIWFAFQGLHPSASLILNIASVPHDPLEVERMALDDITYCWD